MGTPEPRSPDRILNKSLELFSSKGYEATSVREICEAAGITKPTLYHFYGSKEGVYRALVDGTLDAFRRAVSAEIEAPGPAEARLRAVARTYFDFASRQKELMRFIMSLVHNPASSAPRTDFPRFYEEIVGRVAACVQEGVDRGDFRKGPVEVRMLTFMGALGEAMCGYVIVGRPELTRELADAIVDSLIEGWRA